MAKTAVNVTLKDVAAKAGVSTATVSHVLNNTRFVSDELRATVLRAVEATGYYRNDLARGLRRGKTGIIGLMIPDNSNPFFAEMARIVENRGFASGYSVILCNSAGDPTRESAYISALISKQIDGLIFIAAHSKGPHLMALRQRNIPLVIVDRDLQLSFADTILVNNETGGYLATKYLIDLGHRKIACISGPSDVTPSADRVKGYYRALQEAGIEIRDSYLTSGGFQYQGGQAAMAKLLASGDNLSAVFACNDLMALGALSQARLASVRVPEDISIMGFDDIQYASIVTPALSTIAQPVDEVAASAVDMLVERIQNKVRDTEARCIVFGTRLIIRDSCSPLPRQGAGKTQ